MPRPRPPSRDALRLEQRVAPLARHAEPRQDERIEFGQVVQVVRQRVGARDREQAAQAAARQALGVSRLTRGVVHPFPEIGAHVVQAIDARGRLGHGRMAEPAGQGGAMPDRPTGRVGPAVIETLGACWQVAARKGVGSSPNKGSRGGAALFAIGRCAPLRVGWKLPSRPATEGLGFVVRDMGGRLIVRRAVLLAEGARPGPACLARPVRFEH